MVTDCTFSRLAMIYDAECRTWKKIAKNWNLEPDRDDAECRQTRYVCCRLRDEVQRDEEPVDAEDGDAADDKKDGGKMEVGDCKMDRQKEEVRNCINDEHEKEARDGKKYGGEEQAGDQESHEDEEEIKDSDEEEGSAPST